jgi:tetratricopeptide (TPR) repeat protein
MRFVFAFCIVLLPVAALAAEQPKPATSTQLDKLFADLAKADSTEEAKPIEDQIIALFTHSGSPSIDLLMTRALAAEQGGDKDTARKLLDSVTEIAPEFAEGWHERGELLAATGDDEGAMLSLQKAVALNPREFAAMAELGSMLADYGDKPAALAMYRKAMALDPKMEDVERRVRELSRDVEGQGI